MRCSAARPVPHRPCRGTWPRAACRSSGSRALPVELVLFTSAGSVVDAVKARQVDQALVAIDPVRAADMAYIAPCVIIEGTCLVRRDSPLQRNDDVDRPGARIAAGRVSVYA